MKKTIEHALKPVQKQIAELPETAWILNTINTSINRLEEKFDHKYQENDKKSYYLERRIDELEGLSKVLERLDAGIDDGEQYSLRMCLRFNAVSLPAESDKEDCTERVYDVLKAMGCGSA